MSNQSFDSANMSHPSLHYSNPFMGEEQEAPCLVGSTSNGDAIGEGSGHIERSLVKNTTFAITLSRNGIVERWNSLAEEVFGISTEQAIGKRLNELDLDWNIEQVYDLVLESLADFKPYQCELLINENEKTRLVRLNICPTPECDYVQLMGYEITEPRLQRLDHKAQIEAIGRSHAVAEFGLDGSLLTANDKFLEMTGYAIEEIRGKHHSIFCEMELVEDERYLDFWGQLNRGEFECGQFRRYGKDGRELWIHATYNPILDLEDKPFKVVIFAVDLTKEREAANQVDRVSRQAEMAEVANGVLHNVGNVLNSVNTSAHLLERTLQSSRLSVLSKANSMIWDNKDNLADFFTKDEKGQHLPKLLHELSLSLDKEQVLLLDELRHLVERVDHIKEIINMQQSFALTQGASEYESLERLMESALKMLEMMQSDIRIEREFTNIPEVKTKKHKVLQIFVNLLSNAKHALQDIDQSDKCIAVSIYSDEVFAYVKVVDNGVGIPAENMEKIFDHGFTTKKRGHGFGLHSSINAAQDLNGSLAVQSDGQGHGATFTLKLPLERIS